MGTEDQKQVQESKILRGGKVGRKKDGLDGKCPTAAGDVFKLEPCITTGVEESLSRAVETLGKAETCCCRKKLCSELNTPLKIAENSAVKTEVHPTHFNTAHSCSCPVRIVIIHL